LTIEVVPIVAVGITVEMTKLLVLTMLLLLMLLMLRAEMTWKTKTWEMMEMMEMMEMTRIRVVMLDLILFESHLILMIFDPVFVLVS